LIGSEKSVTLQKWWQDSQNPIHKKITMPFFRGADFKQKIQLKDRTLLHVELHSSLLAKDAPCVIRTKTCGMLSKNK
jgi:hypothetical protein